MSKADFELNELMRMRREEMQLSIYTSTARKGDGNGMNA